MLRDTLRTLLSLYGPSGRESAVADKIREMLQDHVDSIETDALGNLIVRKYGAAEDAKTIMVSAHMDHIGLVVTHVEDEGFLRAVAVGGVPAAMAQARKVVFPGGANGVAMLQPDEKEKDKPDLKNLFIDVGASTREEALKVAQVGDVAVYAPDFTMLGRHRAVSPAMDDRCACALLVELMLYADGQKNNIAAVFSAQEEVGTRGAKVAAYAIEPDIGLALDVTGWGDTPETKYPALKLGAGPAVKVMDRNMIASPLVRDLLFAAAQEAGVQVQREVLAFGGTDGGAIQLSRAGVPTGTLSIPCRYVHSALEMVDMRDMEGALKTLLKFVDIA